MNSTAPVIAYSLPYLMILAGFAFLIKYTVNSAMKLGGIGDYATGSPLRLKHALLNIGMGLVGLVGGGQLIVSGAVIISRQLGIAEAVIGLTVSRLGPLCRNWLSALFLRVISRRAGKEITDLLREKGQPVTVFVGEGMKGPVSELYIACRRRDLKWILPEVKRLDENVFYIVEQALDMSKVLKPIHTPLGGWRSVFNRFSVCFCLEDNDSMKRSDAEEA